MKIGFIFMPCRLQHFKELVCYLYYIKIFINNLMTLSTNGGFNEPKYFNMTSAIIL